MHICTISRNLDGSITAFVAVVAEWSPTEGGYEMEAGGYLYQVRPVRDAAGAQRWQLHRDGLAVGRQVPGLPTNVHVWVNLAKALEAAPCPCGCAGRYRAIVARSA